MKIYHIHFRKTGGTALRTVLRRALRPASPLASFSDLEFFGKVREDEQAGTISRCDFISGHFGRLGPLVPAEFFRICVLRDPLRRVVSGFNHIVGDAQDPMHASIEGRSFCQAMEENQFASELWNHQSRMIVQNMGERFDSMSDRQRVDCCLTFLSERVGCLGVLEHPAQLLAALQAKLETEMPPALPSTNVEITAQGTEKVVIRDCLEATVRRNRVDLAVYSFALSRLGF